MRLRNKLLTSFIGFVSLPLLLIAAITCFSIENRLSGSIRVQHSDIAKQAAYELNRYVSDIGDIMGLMASIPQIRDFNRPKEQEDALANLKTRLLGMDYLYLVNTSGHVVTTAPYTDFSGDVDFSGRDWFRQITRDKKPWISSSSIISDANRQPVVFMAYPVFGSDGLMGGVLGGNISLVRVSEYLAKLKFGNTGEVFVIDEKGFVIIHPDTGRVLAREQAPLFLTTDKKESFREINQDSRATKLVTTYPLGDTGWTVLVAQDKREAYQGIYDFFIGTAFITLFVTAAAGLAALGISGKIVKPVVELTGIAEKLGRGRLSEPVRVSDNDELGLLAREFNFMAASIAQRDRDLREAFLRTSEILVNLLELKDPNTAGHSKKVEALAARIGDALGLSPQDIETLRIAAILHDIGKMGISEAILNKAGPLTPEEQVLIETHPAKGAEALYGLDSFNEVRSIIMCHHEQYDGSGYPAGLRGEEIPLGARIISIADAYDVMNSDRAYRKALSLPEIKAVFSKERARQFDPDIVDAFYKVIGWEEVK